MRIYWLQVLALLLPAVAGGRQQNVSLPGWPRSDIAGLSLLLDGVDLRSRVGACVSEFTQAGGHLSVTFYLHLQGGASGFSLAGEQDQDVGLATCLVRVMQNLFGTGRAEDQSVPARLELTVPPTRRQDFSYLLAVPLEAAAPPRLPGFHRTGRLRHDSCPVGRARLHLEASDLFLPTAPPALPKVAEVPAVSACLESRERSGTGHRHRHAIHRRACACLAAVLEKSSLPGKIAAADQLVKLRCRRQRRRLTRQLELLAGRLEAPCDANADERQRSLSTSLLELSCRHLRLRGFLPWPVMETLAARACPRERRALFGRIFDRHPYLFSRVKHLLLGSDGLEVRLRAAQTSCLYSRSGAPETFTELLADRQVENRTLAVLYAPACLHNLQQSNPGLLAGEKDELVLALALRASGLEPRGELLQRTLHLLESRCPAVRFLAGEALSRISDGKGAWYTNALHREGDPWLRRRLEALREGRRPPTPAVVRLWLEWPAGRQAQMGLSSPAPNRSR